MYWRGTIIIYGRLNLLDLSPLAHTYVHNNYYYKSMYRFIAIYLSMCNTHLRSKAQTGSYLHTAVLDIAAIISIIASFLFPSAMKTEAGEK